MGGPNSGNRWHYWRPEKKTTAEECLHVDANRFTRAGVFRAATRQTGAVSWPESRIGVAPAVLVFTADMADPCGPSVRLLYFPEPGGDLVECRLRLLPTPPHFGGLRWWFACPMQTEQGECGRRVGKLYLPPGGRHFGCRRCHDLRYISSQEAHADDRALQTLAQQTGWEPAEVRRVLCGERARSSW
jgi:hypothetical protein